MPSVAAAVNWAQTLLVVCCNGGVPFVDLHVWPLDGATFQAVDPTDWVATQSSLGSGNASQWTRLLQLPADLIDAAACDGYNLSFVTPTFRDIYLQRNGSLACKCPLGWMGESCQLPRPLRLGGGNNHSFKAFLYLAIIPLGFALFAAIGGFVCKLCCCDCFGWSCVCFSKDKDSLDGDSLDGNLWTAEADNRFNSSLERKTTTLQLEPTELTQFLPDIAATNASRQVPKSDFVPIHRPKPVYGLPNYSPPPSYRARDSPDASLSTDVATQTIV